MFNHQPPEGGSVEFGKGPLAQFLLEHNARQSGRYCDPGVDLERKRYRSLHPTELAAMKCMDGRVNLSVMANIQPGIILPFRNVGADFNVGWGYFGELLLEWAGYAASNGRRAVLFMTYHWSRGKTHLGCRGFNYNMEHARDYTFWQRSQVEEMFGKGHEVVYPVCMGVETDEDAFIVHGRNGDSLDLSQCSDMSELELRSKIEELFPDMHPDVVRDLLPILLGNIEHIREVRGNSRKMEDADHRENVIAVGRGFGWLHIINKALIVGPYSPNLDEPIAVAAKIVHENILAKRADSGDNALLLVSSAYRDEGAEQRWAVLKACFHADFAFETIKARCPDLMPTLDVLVGTTDLRTQRFTPIPWAPPIRPDWSFN